MRKFHYQKSTVHTFHDKDHDLMAIVNEDTTRVEFDHFSRSYFYLEDLIHIHKFVGDVIRFLRKIERGRKDGVH